MAAGRRDGEIIHIPTGMAQFDKIFKGLDVGVHTLVECHTGEGKTSLLLSLARGAASAGVPALLISAEDRVQSTCDRAISQSTGIPSSEIEAKELGAGDNARVLNAANAFPANAWLSAGSFDALAVKRCTMAWIEERRGEGCDGPMLVCLDYLQAVCDRRAAEASLSEIGKWLNDVAGLNGISVVSASQVRSRLIGEGKAAMMAMKPPSTCPPNWRDFVAHYRPKKGDAEHCSSLEKTAKCVLVWFRPGRWARDMWQVPDDEGELWVIKRNQGAEGYVRLAWDGTCQRISDRK